MPVGNNLIEAVAGVLTPEGVKIRDIQGRLTGFYSGRAIRYAVAALVKAGRARRKGQTGPVYPVGNGDRQ